MSLVFIHGAGFTGDVFDAQLRTFPNAIAPTLPGHTTAGGASSVAQFAQFVAGELRRLEMRNVVLCGHSLGGAIALQVALDRLHPVEKIVLLGSGARLRVAPAILEGIAAEFETAAQTIAGLMFAEPGDERVDGIVDSMRRVGAAQTLRDFQACDAFDVIERLPEVDVPLLALTGESDRLTPPKYAQALAGRVQRGEARIVPGAGHLVMVERPQETNDAIRAFAE